MPEEFGYAIADVKLRAVVDGIEVPVVRYTSDFEINSIPRASIVVALGRSISGGPSSIHRVLDRLTVRKTAVVYATLTPGETVVPSGLVIGNPRIPVGEFVLFDGYTTGFGDDRGVDAASYTLELIHWLVDLASSSALSASAHPSVPADLAFPHVLRALSADTAAGQEAGGGLTGISLAEIVNRPDAVDDLWGNAILPWYRLLSSTDHLADGAAAGEFGRLFGTATAGPNALALRALDRMKPGSKGSPPLAFRTVADGAAADAIARNVRQEIAQTTFDVLLGQTLWDHLVQMASAYLFAIVPCVESVLVVPWMPTLRTVWATVYAADGAARQLTGDMPRVLRGVALATGKAFDAGANLPADRGDAVPPGGVYRTLGVGSYVAGPEGMILVKDAPTWLAGLPVDMFLNVLSAPDQVRPTPAGPAAGPAPTGATPGDVLAKFNPVLRNFARTLYGLEVLKYRAGVVYGKFRCDVAPGSVVRVEGAGERFLAETDQLGRPVYAAVLKVSQVLDAETKQCMTSFGLAHVRTETENNAEATSLTEHPLYAKAWVGANLIG